MYVLGGGGGGGVCVVCVCVVCLCLTYTWRGRSTKFVKPFSVSLRLVSSACALNADYNK